LQGFVSIERYDFERNGSLEYHTGKIIRLLTLCFEQLDDVEKMGVVVNSLLIVYTTKR
jgi:hypothetical protein